MIVGVLALQGAFIEHEQMLRKLGADTVELREKEDLQHKPDALILPGGESTAQGKLLKENPAQAREMATAAGVEINF